MQFEKQLELREKEIETNIIDSNSGRKEKNRHRIKGIEKKIEKLAENNNDYRKVLEDMKK